MKREKDYKQIQNDIEEYTYILLKPMDVRLLLQLDTKAAYALFKEESFPAIKVSGKNYITKKEFIEWFKNTYKDYLK